MVGIWYNGAVKSKDAIELQMQLRECIKNEAKKARLACIEYDVSIDSPLNGESMSQKSYFLARIPNAPAYMDNLATGEVVVTQIRVTKNDRAMHSYPLCISQAVGIEDQLALLMKPILEFRQKARDEQRAQAGSEVRRLGKDHIALLVLPGGGANAASNRCSGRFRSKTELTMCISVSIFLGHPLKEIAHNAETHARPRRFLSVLHAGHS